MSDTEIHKIKCYGEYITPDPEYRIPKNLPLKIVLLALIASGRGEWDYKTLETLWVPFFPHPKAYNAMVRYITELKRSGCVEIPEPGRVRIKRGGIIRLRYYNKKIGFPKILRGGIEHLLEE